jgi:hypothetical protein
MPYRYNMMEMMARKVWDTYCRLYGRFGEGPISVPEVLSRMRISEPMCRKVVWTLKREGLLERVRKEGRKVKFRIVPPAEVATKLVLSSPHVRYRELLKFFGSIQWVDWYVVGTTALNYYAPYYAPSLELGSENPRQLNAALKFPYLRVQSSKRVPKSYEVAELEGVVFKIASVEDAIVQSYAAYPKTQIALHSLDYMAAIAMKIKGGKLDTKRFDELPAPARKHLRGVVKNLSSERDPLNEIGDMAELFLSAAPSTHVCRFIETLAEDALWPT